MSGICQQSDNPEPKNYPWAERFIEIALRAMRRVHYEYGVWGVGQQWLEGKSEPHRLNMGPGIELADEPTVCAAITQEFANSQLVAGAWVDEDSESDVVQGERFWRIDREQPYNIDDQRKKKDNQGKKVDFCIQRYNRKDLGEKPVPYGQLAFIEAKRARYWPNEVSTGSSEPPLSPNIDAVRKDVEKLRQEMKVREEQGTKILCHLLVWSVCEKLSEDGPLEFFNKLNDPRVVIHQLRWLPLEWTYPTHEEVIAKNIKQPEIKKSLWIALAQVCPNP